MKIVVVGFGRFGALWCDILRQNFEVVIVESDQEKQRLAQSRGFPVLDFGKCIAGASAVFYAVPISAFAEVISAHYDHYVSTKNPPLIVDLLSVKELPAKVIQQYLPSHVRALLTHPMFGPDSVATSGLNGQAIAVDRFTASEQEADFWLSFFEGIGLKVVELSAANHDEYAAWSQGIAHLIGRILGEMKVGKTPIDTLGARKLLEIRDQVCNDSWQLFEDLQRSNQFTGAMRLKFAEAQATVFNRLLPPRLNTNKYSFGIQGGRGSFNEAALRSYLQDKEFEAEVHYLHTSENVLRALHEGKIDFGQFALHNSLGGVVHESINAMGMYNYSVVSEYSIVIAHALMIRSGVEFAEIDTIMTHPQVLRQCRQTLADRYPTLKQTSGEGELVDHAKVAELMAQGKIAKNVAVMGSRVLAEIYGLNLIEDNLQDLKQNFTSFLLVARPGAAEQIT